MDTVRDVITVILLGSGLSFMLIGAWGVVRLPDAYHRLHASSKCSTLGLLFVLAIDYEDVHLRLVRIDRSQLQ